MEQKEQVGINIQENNGGFEITEVIQNLDSINDKIFGIIYISESELEKVKKDNDYKSVFKELSLKYKDDILKLVNNKKVA